MEFSSKQALFLHEIILSINTDSASRGWSRRMIEDILKKPILILGCGNILFGDDGFGPAVIEHLEAYALIARNRFGHGFGNGYQRISF